METLIEKAIQARELAYCPYSGFAVGAALESKDGHVYTGCNIENGAFTPSNCAERTAFFKAVSEGVKEFRRIVVVGGDRGKPLQVTVPCGVCLQVMLEFCDPAEFEVIFATTVENYEIHCLQDLIPYGFHFERS